MKLRYRLAAVVAVMSSLIPFAATAPPAAAATAPPSFAPVIVYRGVPNDRPWNIVYNFPGGSCWIQGQEGNYTGVPYGGATIIAGQCSRTTVYVQIKAQWEAISTPLYSPSSGSYCTPAEGWDHPNTPRGCSGPNFSSAQQVAGDVSNPIHGGIVQTDIEICSYPGQQWCQTFRLSPFPLN